VWEDSAVSRAHEEYFTIAAFFDLENVAGGTPADNPFDVEKVLERLLDKGNVVVKKAYADWARHQTYKRPFHEQGIELIDMPGGKISGKNSADIKMVVDALELSFTKPHIDTFALISGDSDFSPLVSKLRENGKFVIGVGVKKASSRLLIDNCDEFIMYDDLVEVRTPKPRKPLDGLPTKKREAFQHLLDAASALLRDDRVLYSSLVKDTIKRKQPQFSEEYHGYSSFSRLLEDAEKHRLIELRRDGRSGTYVIDDVLID
jgi:uncharacterized protein (TIGR00288 family)